MEVVYKSLIAKVRRAKRASGAAWLRFFGKTMHTRNFGDEVTYVRTSVRPLIRVGGGEAGQPLGTGVFRQFSLAGNRVAALHLETLVFLVGNHISDEQRNKEQGRAGKSMREETTKFEIFK